MKETGVKLPKMVSFRLSEESYDTLKRFTEDHTIYNSKTIAETAREIVEDRLRAAVDFREMVLKRLLVMDRKITMFITGELRLMSPERANNLKAAFEKIDAGADDLYHTAIEKEMQQRESRATLRGHKKGVKE